MREIPNALLGRARAGEVLVVTERGVEIPLANAHHDWNVVELTRLLGEIDRLPECEHPLGWPA